MFGTLVPKYFYTLFYKGVFQTILPHFGAVSWFLLQARLFVFTIWDSCHKLGMQDKTQEKRMKAYNQPAYLKASATIFNLSLFEAYSSAKWEITQAP